MGRDTIEGSEETVIRGGDVHGQWPRGCTGERLHAMLTASMQCPGRKL